MFCEQKYNGPGWGRYQERFKREASRRERTWKETLSRWKSSLRRAVPSTLIMINFMARALGSETEGSEIIDLLFFFLAFTHQWSHPTWALPRTFSWVPAASFQRRKALSPHNLSWFCSPAGSHLQARGQLLLPRSRRYQLMWIVNYLMRGHPCHGHIFFSRLSHRPFCLLPSCQPLFLLP